MVEQRYSEYDQWAWLYNRTAGPAYCQAQISLLERVLYPALKPGSRVLDLCCGTGQIMQPLIARGYRLTGLDGSQSMLDHAAQNAPRAELVLGDARSFGFESPFEAVICTSASLNHLATLEDLTRVFHCVSAALDEGGIFLFDVNHEAQMRAHWRGQAAEGAIHADYAWLITPTFDSASAAGAFHIDIFQRAGARSPRWKTLLGAGLGWRRLNGLRLRVLKHFARWQPQWQHTQLRYAVHGHKLRDIESALKSCGFGDISAQTLAGTPVIDQNGSAHFVCIKTHDSRHSSTSNREAAREQSALSAL